MDFVALWAIGIFIISISHYRNVISYLILFQDVNDFWGKKKFIIHLFLKASCIEVDMSQNK